MERYRPTMDFEVLKSWAENAQKNIDELEDDLIVMNMACYANRTALRHEQDGNLNLKFKVQQLEKEIYELKKEG